MAMNLSSKLERLRTRLSPQRSMDTSPPSQRAFEPAQPTTSTLAPKFFDLLPREVRDIIYDELLGSLVAHVVAGRESWRHQPDTIKYRARSSGKAIYDRLIGPGHVHTTEIFRKKKGDRIAILVGKKKPCVPALLVNRQFCRELLERVHWWSIVGVALPPSFSPVLHSLPGIVGETHVRSLWLSFCNKEPVTNIFAYLRKIIAWCTKQCVSLPNLTFVFMQIYTVFQPAKLVWNLADSAAVKNICASWPVLKDAKIVTFAKQVGKGKELVLDYAIDRNLHVGIGAPRCTRVGDAERVPYCVRVERKGLESMLGGVGKSGKKR